VFRFCVGTDLAVGLSPIQGDLANVKIVCFHKLILNWIRPEGLIRNAGEVADKDKIVILIKLKGTTCLSKNFWKLICNAETAFVV
jgi:hypothetical protein